MIANKSDFIEKIVEALEDNDLINMAGYLEAKNMVKEVLDDELREYAIVPSMSILI